jgi:allantoinase
MREARSVDLVIKNSKMVLEARVVEGGVGVLDGKICIIATDEHLPDATTIIDADGNYLLPGLIDGHAHIHDEHMLEHEDYTTGSRAAAAGGVTTIINMPLTSQIDTPKLVDNEIEQGQSMSLVDFSMYAGMMNSENVQIIYSMIEKGIAAFKAFTCEPFQTNDGVITNLLSEVSEFGGHVTIHSENQGVLDEFKKGFQDEWDAPISHSLSRPNLAEQMAVRQVIGIVGQTGGHLHIAHISTREGLHEVEQGQQMGYLVTTEVCPHHLVFQRDEMNRLGPKSKMNPPLRSKEDRAALWAGLLRGAIDMVVSDHAPCPIEKKEAGTKDIRDAWSGVDGIQMILRVLLSEGINKARLTLHRLVKAASRNPAKIFGLYPKKGTIQVGSDADLILVDLSKEEKITADMMFSKCGWTLYEGMTMKGALIRTFVRGVQVFHGDRTTIKPGHGEFQFMGGNNLAG